MQFFMMVICVLIGTSIAIPPPLLWDDKVTVGNFEGDQLSTTGGGKDFQSTGQITEPPNEESGSKIIETSDRSNLVKMNALSKSDYDILPTEVAFVNSESDRKDDINSDYILNILQEVTEKAEVFTSDMDYAETVKMEESPSDMKSDAQPLIKADTEIEDIRLATFKFKDFATTSTTETPVNVEADKIKDSSNDMASGDSSSAPFLKPKVTEQVEDVFKSILDYIVNIKLEKDKSPNELIFNAKAPELVVGKTDGVQKKEGKGVKVAGINEDVSDSDATLGGSKTIKIQGLNPLNTVLTLDESSRVKAINSETITNVGPLHPAPDRSSKNLEEREAINAKDTLTVFPHKYYFLKNDFFPSRFANHNVRFATFPRFSPVFPIKSQNFLPPPFSSLFPQLPQSADESLAAGEPIKWSPIPGKKMHGKERKEAKNTSFEKKMLKMVRKLVKQESEIKQLLLQLANSQADTQDSVNPIEHQIKKYSGGYGIDSDTSLEKDNHHESSANSYSYFKHI